MTMMTTIKDTPLRMVAKAHVAALSIPAMLAPMSAMADDTAETANIRGALETNQEALTAVNESTFTEDGVESGAQAITNAVLYAVGAIGIILTVAGIYQLWKHSKEGDRAQGNAGQGVAMIAIGGIMTIAAVATAIVPNLVLGADAG